MKPEDTPDVMPTVEDNTITLLPETMRLIQEAVEAGEFNSTGDALQDAVEVWQRRRLENAERLAAMRERIQRSLDDPRPTLTQAEAEGEMKRFMNERASMPRHVAR